MKQLEREIKATRPITYKWWKYDGEIKDTHVEALEETAKAHIFEMTAGGYTSGQLVDNIRVDDSDGEDGVEYTGWWGVKSTGV